MKSSTLTMGGVGGSTGHRRTADRWHQGGAPRSQSRSRWHAQGFTLIEVMIVIAIILALSGLVGIALFSQRDTAKANTARIDLNSMKHALDLFRLDFDRYPKDEEGLAVLWDKSKLDPEADQTKWKAYLSDPMPNDKWGHPWGYKQVTEHDADQTKYDLWSYGPDGQDGTEDDITSWANSAADGSTGGTGVSAPPPSAPPPSSPK